MTVKQNQFQLQETLEAHLSLPKLWFMDPLLRERSLVVLHPPLTHPSSFNGTFQWLALPSTLVQDHSGGDSVALGTVTPPSARRPHPDHLMLMVKQVLAPNGPLLCLIIYTTHNYL